MSNYGRTRRPSGPVAWEDEPAIRKALTLLDGPRRREEQADREWSGHRALAAADRIERNRMAAELVSLGCDVPLSLREDVVDRDVVTLDDGRRCRLVGDRLEWL